MTAAPGLASILSLALALCFAAYPEHWKDGGVPGQYRCYVPAAWGARPTSDGGMVYGDGNLAIIVTRYADKKSFQAALGSPKPEYLGGVMVSKVGAALYRRQQKAGPRWLYEEIAMLPAGSRGFFVLRFESPSNSFQSDPGGLDIWNSFLGGFRFVK